MTPAALSDLVVSEFQAATGLANHVVKAVFKWDFHARQSVANCLPESIPLLVFPAPCQSAGFPLLFGLSLAPMDYVKRARIVFDIEIDALRQTRARLDGNFSAAVELIVESLRNRG